MYTPETLTQRLQAEEDIDSAVEVYKAAQDAVKSYEAVKEAARAFVSAHLAQTGQLKGKTTAGSFGITRPPPPSGSMRTNGKPLAPRTPSWLQFNNSSTPLNGCWTRPSGTFWKK